MELMVVDADFEFDVFISYSHRDKAWVRGELLERIEKGGLRAFVDFRDFTPGAPSIKNMEHGAKHCRHTLLVLSLIHISEPTRLGMISYAVFCLKKKKKKHKK